MGIEFCVLGPLEVRVDGTPVAIGGPRQRALLALLLLSANRVVDRDRLVELFADSPADGTDHALRMQVSRLRKTLDRGDEEPSRLLARPPGYILRVGPDELDLDRFEGLAAAGRAALERRDFQRAHDLLVQADGLWRGRAFADLIDTFVRVDSDRLDGLRLAAIEDRIDAQLALRRHAVLTAELEARVAEHPLRERLRAQLMLALYRCGRQAEALDTYRAARTYLHDELGIEPGPALRAMERAILRQDPALDLLDDDLHGYRLLEKIGDRPFSALYRAVEPRVERDVVVEIFTAPAGDAAFAVRLEQEARALAALDHRGIVPLYDHWSTADRAFLVYRYMRGGSLADLDRQARSPATEQAGAVIERISAALAYAHDHGVSHGRVRPAAVLFDDEHNAYLGDFQVGFGPADPTVDVRALAVLIRHLSGGHLSASLADLCGRAATTTDPPSAAEFAATAAAQNEGGEQPPAPFPGEVRNPYKGLRSYAEADADDFFGRSSLVERLLDRFAENDAEARFLAVVGPSGCGKSSVVRAGLIPAIRRGSLHQAGDVFIAEMRPGAHPVDEMASALERALALSTVQLYKTLAAGSRGLLDAVSSAVPADGNMVLVVDQFEEVFTLCQDAHERDRFMELLRVGAVDPDSRLTVVVTLRADLYDRPLRHPRFAQLLAARTVAVPPLTPDELEQAIRRPSEQVGVTLETGLVAEMIAAVAHQPGTLPLLQYALTELFERRAGDHLQLETYRAIGGVAGALSARADAILNETTAEQHRAAKQVFLRLVALGEGAQDTRRRVRRSELDDLEVDRSALDYVLGLFGRHRLLTFDRDAGTGEPTVEIAHEALLVAWEPLRGWIDDAREDLRQQRRLSRSASEWESSGLDPSFLMRGARLEQAMTWIAGSDLAIGHGERAYLVASAAARDREQDEKTARRAHEIRIERRARVRLRALVAVFAVAALIAGILTAVARNQTRRAGDEARLASARELAAASAASLGTDPERSILLAIEAVRLSRESSGGVIPEAVQALHSAIAASRVVLTLPGDAGPVAWGRGDVFAQDDPHAPGAVVLESASTGRRILEVRGSDSRVEAIAFSPDGLRLATASDDGGVRIWDPTTGGLVAALSASGSADAVSFGDGGALLCAVWGEGTVKILRTGTRQVVWQRQIAGAADASLSPDGRRLAVTTVPMGGAVFDVAADRMQFALPGAGGSQTPRAARISWSPDGRYIAGTSTEATPSVWNARTGARLFTLRGHTGPVVSLAWSPQSTGLVTGGSEGTAKVWSVGSLGARQVLSLSGLGTAGGAWNVAYSPDGTKVLTSGRNVNVWDVGLDGDAELAHFPPADAGSVIDFLPDGNHVVDVSSTTTVTDWNVATKVGERIATGDVVVDSLAIDPSTGAIAVGGRALGNRDANSVGVIDADGRERYLPAPCCDTTDVTFSADGRYLAVTGADGNVTVFDSAGHIVARVDNPPTAVHTRFRPASTQIATTLFDHPAGVQFVEVADWEKHASVWGAENVSSQYVNYDLSGSRVVLADSQGRPQIADAATGRLLTTLAAPPYGTDQAVFSPDGTVIATAGTDGSVSLFDVASGAEQMALPSVGCAVLDLAFSLDGRRLASASPCDGVRVWALDVNDLVRIAERKVTRTLTAGECSQYLHERRCPSA